MKSLQIPIIFTVIVLLGSIVYYFYSTNKIKKKYKLLDEQIVKFTEKYKAEGLDKHYQSWDTKKLIKEYKKILDAYDEYMDNQEKVAELGGQETLISDVLAARGIDIDELINTHAEKADAPKNGIKENIKIASFKLTLVLSYILSEVIFIAAVVLFSFGFYNQVYSQGMGWAWFTSTDNLLECLVLLLFIVCIYILILHFKMNVYYLELKKEHFTYKFILKKTIPYSNISRIMLVSYRSKGGEEVRMLKIILKHKNKVRIRLDHLNINNFDDVIRPRKPNYLKEYGNENLILDFLASKTRKIIEKKTGERYFY